METRRPLGSVGPAKEARRVSGWDGPRRFHHEGTKNTKEAESRNLFYRSTQRERRNGLFSTEGN
jgi:hypothetical protein